MLNHSISPVSQVQHTSSGIPFSALLRTSLYFPDGNIILVAGNALFKVHLGQLARHSEVFHGLLTLPTPPEDQLFEGCQWLELYDSPKDVFYWLASLYDGLYFPSPRALQFPMLASTLRLSGKYFATALHGICTERFALDWPGTLEGWDRREGEATLPSESGPRYCPRDFCPHPVAAIFVAIELDLPELLPAAMYDLARYGPSRVLVGAIMPHGPYSDEPAHKATGSGPHEVQSLPRDLLVRTLRGREHGQRFISSYISRELQERVPSSRCFYSSTQVSSPSPCQESFYFITLNILRSVGGIASGRDGDPLFTLLHAKEMMDRTDFEDGQGDGPKALRICGECRRELSQSLDDAREEVWNSLPQWFGLEKEECTEAHLECPTTT
ncbi:hypothetical protein BD626DRAFT_414013 [Schizophyllum amplum]|uniref:BTB domain-containing protein n=1 Tax=Schizophyllum amplum TaxID=97359 RepID=A0A550BV54_9AGAR|nr:hypothetical protein BD626DRAFT_414013 [Auriculariopsis ampla]